MNDLVNVRKEIGRKMQTTKVSIRDDENKITEYHGRTGGVSQEEIEAVAHVRVMLDNHKEELRCQQIDKAVDGYIRKGRRIEINRRKKPTLWEMLIEFLGSFTLFDLLSTIALLSMILIAARW